MNGRGLVSGENIGFFRSSPSFPQTGHQVGQLQQIVAKQGRIRLVLKLIWEEL